MSVLKNKYKTVAIAIAVPVVLGTMAGVTSLAKVSNDASVAVQLSCGNKVVAQQLFDKTKGNGVVNKVANEVATAFNNLITNQEMDSNSLSKFFIEDASKTYWDTMQRNITSSKKADLEKTFETHYNNGKHIANNSGEHEMLALRGEVSQK